MFRRLGSIVLVVLSAMVLAQHTNLGSLLLGEDCSENCRGDIAPHHCAPGCGACSCVGHASVLSPAMLDPLPALPAPAGVSAYAAPELPEPPPESIFHVPRSPRA